MTKTEVFSKTNFYDENGNFFQFLKIRQEGKLSQVINSRNLTKELGDLQKSNFVFNPKTIAEHKTLKKILKRKHRGITRASIFFGMDIRNFSKIINGHGYTIRIIQSIQSDLGLSDTQVLHLWPQLKEWPREPYSRVKKTRR